ncbi:MAG TPA: hypothetical protein DF712_18450 [Balneola sp.]|nr:hypothetical protein [Balneola sp.]|tara:strand:- start:24563 stop:25504 length:942 start_codon:yes stop_codon:yes gene_type:complete
MTWIVKGLPFSTHQSSCSNTKPTMFSWDDDIDLDVELWVDYSIEQGITAPREKKYKYAWICESRAIHYFFSKLYDTDTEGRKVVNGITPTLQSMIDSYDIIFTCDWDLIALHEKIQFAYAGSTLPWIAPMDPDDVIKSKSCSFVSSNKNMCLGHSYRKDVYDYIKKEDLDIDVYGTITGKDFFGTCNRCWERGGEEGWMDKRSAIVDYKFSIVMENDFHPSYFTEKVTDCFSSFTIPIYMGTPDLYRWFDPDGIIYVSSVDEMKECIKYYSDNDLWDALYKEKLYHVGENWKKVQQLRHPDDIIFAQIKEASK